MIGVHSMDIVKTADSIFSGIYQDYRKLVKYLAVGIVGTIADWIVFALFLHYTVIFYALAMVVSYSVGTVINYVLNRRFTFNNTYKKVHYQFASFALIAVVGFGIQELLMFGIVQYVFGDSSADTLVMVARMVATFVGFAWTFIANKKITFKVFQ